MKPPEGKTQWRGVELVYRTSGPDERWAKLQRVAGQEKPIPGPIVTRISATAQALRCDWEMPGNGKSFSLILNDRATATLLDHRQRSVMALRIPPAATRQRHWTAEAIGKPRKTGFGLATTWTLVPPAGRGGDLPPLSARLVAGGPVGRWLGPLWRLIAPPLLAAGLPSELPIELSFGVAAATDPDAAMRLERRSEQSFSPDHFAAPRGYGRHESPRRDAPPRDGDEEEEEAAPPTPAPSMGASAQREERAKLLVRDSLVQAVTDIVNRAASFVVGFGGVGLTLALSSVYDQMHDGDPVIGGLVDRVLLVQLIEQLKPLTEPLPLRHYVTAVADAVIAGNPVSSVPQPPNLTPEQLAALAPITHLLGIVPSVLAEEFKAVWLVGDPAEFGGITLVLQVVQPIEQGRHLLLKSWFDSQFGILPLRPKPALRQSGGRNKGWTSHGYVEDGVAELVDFELDIDGIGVGVGQPLIDPLVPVGAGDLLVDTLRALAILKGDPAAERVGFRTRLHIAQLSASGTATTVPTTESVVIVALLFTYPLALAALWQSLSGSLTAEDITIELAVLFRNDPLDAADPGLEVYLFGPQFGDVDFGAFGLNVLLLFPPLFVAYNALLNILGDVVAGALVDSLSSALFEMLDVVDEDDIALQPLLYLNREAYRDHLEAAVRSANATQQMRNQLHTLTRETPAGRNKISIRHRPQAGYDLALAITRPGTGGPLEFPLPGVTPSADFTLLLSNEVARYFLEWAGYGVGYGGVIRNTVAGAPELFDYPELDWWRDAPEPQLLGQKPNFRTGPPQVAMIPGASLPDWVGYSGGARVDSGVTRLFAVDNPTPDTPIAELTVTVQFEVGVTTFTAVTYEVCEDVTRLAEWLDRFGGDVVIERFDPSDPPPPWAEGIASIRRLGQDAGIIARGPTSQRLDTLSRMLRGRGGETAPDDLAPYGAGGAPGPIFSPGRAPGGLPGAGGYGYAVVCRQVTSWDVKAREQWLTARLSLTVPVLFGLGALFADRPHFLPPMSYRFDLAGIVAGELTATVPEGPLGGLLQGQNRDWLRQIMINHAATLLGGHAAAYRLGNAPGLYYAYGLETPVELIPEGYRMRALVALHPDFWTQDQGDPQVGGTPPYIALQTFGADPERLNLAVSFHLATNVLNRLRGR